MAQFADDEVGDGYDDDQFDDVPDEMNPDGSPLGMWKIHRIKESSPQVYTRLLKLIKRLNPTVEPLPVPELIEEVQELKAPAPGLQQIRKVTILVTGPVVVPGRDSSVVRMLWDDVAQVLLREDMLASPITMRLLPPSGPREMPTLITIIAAGANEDWEAMRLMIRANLPQCLEENGMVVRANRAQLQRFAETVLDSVDVVLYCDRLHKYHLTLADQDLIRKLSTQYGEEFWERTVVTLTNDGYSYAPASCSLGDLVEGRVSSIGKEVNESGIRVNSRRKGGLLGLIGGRRLFHLPSAVIDGSEMFLMPAEDQALEPIIPDGSWSAINLFDQVVKIANRRGAGYSYPRGMTPNEDVAERVVPVEVVPAPKKEAPKPPRQRKAPGGQQQLGAGMPGFPGAQRPGFGPQGVQWEMAVQADRIKLQERKKEVETKGWLRIMLGRVAGSDLKWLPYIIIGQVMLYQRALLPLIQYYRDKDLHYAMLEYQAKKQERQRIGLQPPRGLEVDGVYVEEPWSDGEAYVQHLKDKREKEIARYRQQQQQQG